MTARSYDGNGWFEVKGNPLSKAGVYPYSGAQIGAPAEDAAKIFNVLRPPEELSDPETIKSFQLVPLIDDHTMLGDGFTSTDDKGVPGVIGQDVYFEDGVLYGNPKIYSKALAEKIKNGKTELSCGYRCQYEFTPGVWNGQAYDAIQRTLRGNHVALVDEGRMGPTVSILDHMVITVDAKETIPVDPELKAALEAIAGRLDKLEAAGSTAPAVEDQTPTPDPAPKPDPAPAPAPAPDPVPPAKDEDAPVTKESMDAALKTIADLQTEITALKARPAMDEATVVANTARKADLVGRISRHIGTFDAANMTVSQVIDYGVEKLQIKTTGDKAVALDAFLQAKPVPAPITPALDGSTKTPLSESINKFVAGA